MQKFKSFICTFLFIYSFSLINAIFVAYGLGDGDIFLPMGERTSQFSLLFQRCAWAFIPSLALTSLFILLQPLYFLEVILYIVATFINFATITHAVELESLIDAQSLYIMLYSGTGEMLEFIKLYSSGELIIILCISALLPLFLWKLVKNNRVKFTFINKLTYLLLSMALLYLIPMHRPGLAIEGYTSWHKGPITPANIDRNVRKLFFVQLLTYIPQALQINNLETSVPTGVESLFDGPQNIVLIITESTNRNQLSLYGYPRKTTPQLDELDLIVYKDVISSGSVTSNSAPHMLTFSNLDSSRHHTTIYDIFKMAGFTTYYFDGYKGVDYNDIIHHIGKRADHIYRTVHYDEEILKSATDVMLNDPTEKKLLVIQTGVAHFPYPLFYPPDTDAFTGTPPNLYPNADPEKRNEYDTAIRYIDTILSDFLIKVANKENTLVLITSDHGQEVGYYSTKYGTSNSSSLVTNYETPFYLYISEDYKDSLNNLVFDVNRPYQTDNLLHSLLDLSHIKTPLFQPELSIFNTKYIEDIQYIHNREYKFYKLEQEKKLAKAKEEALQK